MNLTDFARELINNGFRVFHNPSHPSYLYAVIDGKIGYVQSANGVGHSYTTVHKPNTSTGTGFRYADGELNVGTMKRCCECHAPEWWRQGGVEKWKLDKWIAANPHLTEMK